MDRSRPRSRARGRALPAPDQAAGPGGVRRLITGERPCAGEPRVSIATVVRNAARTLERTIESVLAQTFGSLEYVIIDGASTDGTTDLIRGYQDRIAYWVSEPDRGISDAFNKGVAATRGAYVGLLNGDDWMPPGQVQIAFTALERSGAAFAFGDVLYHDADGRPTHLVRGDPDYAARIAYRMPDVHHPTMLVRRSVYDAVGPFDPAYAIAMDYDWLQRAHRAGFRGVYVPGLVAHMSLAGASDRRHLAGLGEVRVIAVTYGYPRGRAWLRYGYCVAKGLGQRALGRFAPRPVYHLLRQSVNRSYRAIR